MRVLTVVVAAGLLLAACTTAQPPAAPRATPVRPPQVPAIDIFDTGTWEKSLTSTDCTDFTTKMTGAEQFHLSRLLLHQQRTGTLPSAPAPDNAMISRFQQGIANTCGEQGGAYNLIAAAVVVYILDKSFEPAYR